MNALPDLNRATFANFFAHRPVFAWALAILVMLGGSISLMNLPIAQYPSIAPPSISIVATYPGASAKTIEETVTQVIENKMKGLDGLLYMRSASESTGTATITLTFDNKTNIDTAQMQVQNKLQLATASLPSEVQRQGLQVNKAVRNFLSVIGFISKDGSQTAIDLGDYINTYIADAMSRVEGVGEVTLFSSQYAMRVWLNQDKLNQYSLTSIDVVNALQANNAVVTAGQLGDVPSVAGQPINATIHLQGRLKTAEDFGNILIKSDEQGSVIRIKDVARVELGAEGYGRIARYKGVPVAGLAVKLASGANALDTQENVIKKLEELKVFFPKGMDYVVAYDTTPFVKMSIQSVIQTLLEAIVLVFLVMYLFLGNFRATLIPTIAVPVVLLGTFGVLALFGYSINTLTMFAMVLAIGLLVDDAIVVVENVERIMHEEGVSAKEATQRSMNQISGALIGIGLVLSAVFLPMAFFPGSAGVIYQQFSVTIVSAMVLSVLTAFILTPALCATILKPVDKEAENKGFYGWFNRGFMATTRGYASGVRAVIRWRYGFVILYLAVIAGVTFLYLKTPSGFLPNEDQGMMMSQVMMPAGATQEQTLAVVKKLEAHFLEKEANNIDGLFTILGFNFSGTGQNTAMAFIKLKDWSERPLPSQSVNAISGRAMQAFSQINEAMVFAFAPPAVMELGNAAGFDMFLKDNVGMGREALINARNQLLGMASQTPGLIGVRPNGQEPAPTLKLEVDRDKAAALGLSLAEVNKSLSIAWGSAYVDDFIYQGKVKRVFVQADADSRMTPEDLKSWYVRNNQGDLVPVSSFATLSWTQESPKLERYNGEAAMEVMGMSLPFISSGQALSLMEGLVAKLPAGVSLDWTGLSYEEKKSGQQAMLLYILSVLVIFLVLAALYESWGLPISVMLVLPLGVLGVLLAAMLTGKPSDIYFQVGMLTILGLATKNAILIVEFAKEQVEQGVELVEATVNAARMRLRPIIMTSLAFGFGVLPLALSTGAGSGAHNAIGNGVIGGMLSATLLGIFFIPMFFVLVQQFLKKRV
ncbi:efflux RND transporter permease subunit [Thiosulfativibrio zosterae]|uniref:Efflux pump membrane transporter n=1 Tax=Thiosulfativibrio zosterae TaxID=2675053 RepID=A0A6F8PPT6_9GAMM|nr:efflux RND transporter permease subunit [Thiosulfativibrio zosterae]BBP44010.1 multidrug efflux RND transporter permease subunit [Thiosulfativibrio zosterae]